MVQRSIVVVLLVCWLQSLAIAQSELPGALVSWPTPQLTRLEELNALLQKKLVQRGVLRDQLRGAKDGELLDERQQLEETLADITTLSSTFELVALGNTDITAVIEDAKVQIDWRQDLLDILKPLVDSLKSLTKKPRQISDLRDQITSSAARIIATEQALLAIGAITTVTLSTETATRLAELEVKWKDDQDQFRQEQLVAQSQLDRLTNDETSFVSGMWPATRQFVLGRGLTLLMMLTAAVVAWGAMRSIWWLYSTKFTTKALRRENPWYRLAEYSFYLVTVILTVCAGLVVIYARQDLLLLAIALLLIAGAVLSFRQFLPDYVQEARLLLNLGAVREDQRVMYNGLPWQVMSLNLTTVLRNPALDGVIRLPLSVVAGLVSRPVKNQLWFPTDRDDIVLLADGTMGKVRVQTPDLVEVSIRGGMSVTYPTSEFYSMSLTNMTRQDSFMVAGTFGFDYAHQAISLVEIPTAIEAAMQISLAQAGYKKTLRSLVVELASANTSSLDYMILLSVDSSVAGDYFRLERLIQQTCVAVSNDHGWTIPYPQLVVHNAP